MWNSISQADVHWAGQIAIQFHMSTTIHLLAHASCTLSLLSNKVKLNKACIVKQKLTEWGLAEKGMFPSQWFCTQTTLHSGHSPCPWAQHFFHLPLLPGQQTQGTYYNDSNTPFLVQTKLYTKTSPVAWRLSPVTAWSWACQNKIAHQG